LPDGGCVKIDGVLGWNPNSSESYEMGADVTASDITSAQFFPSADSAHPPALEGKFDLRGRLTSRSRDLAGLARRLGGDLQVTSKAGVFRILSAGALPKLSTPAKPTAFGAIIGDVTGAVGAVTGRKDAGDIIAAKARAIADLAGMISAIHYDQMKFTLSRDASSNTLLKDFALISPQFRLEGSGRATYQEDTPLPRQPVALQFKLRARDHAADLLNELGLLDPRKDELGYAACTLPFEIGGTLENPDTSALRLALLETLYERSGAGDLLDRLLGVK
jgi:hypothetical protein